MKEMTKGSVLIVILAVFMTVCGTASAQTYSGYLKLDDTDLKGPDSLLVTISIPEDAYVRDTVFLSRSELRDMKKAGEYSHKSYYATPWLMGVKTNLLSDVIAIPYAGAEVQLLRQCG